MSKLVTSEKIELLNKIEQAFESAYLKYGEPPSIQLQNVTPEIFKNYLDTWGIINIDDVYNNEDARKNYQRVIREMSLNIFSDANPHNNATYETEFKRISEKYPNFTNEEKELATITLWWNSKNGFGNSSFRFLFHQFTRDEDVPSIEIGGEKISLSWNPYHRLTLRVLDDYPMLWELLKSNHAPKTAMISWDSQKIRFQEVGRGQTKGDQKSTKPGVTLRHRDLYSYGGKDVDRLQAMLVNQDPEAIALGWTLFAHLPEIRDLLDQYFGTKNSGFTSVEDPMLNPIIDKYWRAPLRGFVAWSTYSIHYEGKATADRKYERAPINSDLDKISNRIVMGPHSVVDIDQDGLTKLALLSEYGYQPSIYKNRNKNTKVTINVVNKKTTQYMVPRERTNYEIASLEAVIPIFAQGGEGVYIDGLPKIYQEMYGIYK